MLTRTQRAFGLFVVAVAGMSCADDAPRYTDADPGPDAVGADGNVGAPDAGLDETPPDTTITEAPADPSNQPVARFEFEADDDATFECRVDDGPFAACLPGFEATVADGAHRFEVRATDEAGNLETDPATHAWTVDTDPPQTTITTAPPALDNSVDVAFTFTSDEAGSFSCRLDGGAFAACGSPHPLTGLADGAHTFEVRATDEAGNPDPSPASHTWTLDSSTPDTVIDAGLSTGSSVNVSAASFAFSSPDAGGDATFQCRLDGASFTGCTSPISYTGLAAGEHTFEVRVLDAVGNPDPSPARRTWMIDLTAPDTTIDSGPTGTVPTSSASLGFSASEAASFACQLDGGGFVACTSPHPLAGLAEGDHVFRVRATDLAGNPDASPASRSWTVDTIAPDTTLVSAPPSPSNDPAPSIAFTSDEAGATFECQLDGGGFVACTSPRALGGLAAGSHTFQVRASDAGLTDASPASHTWVVDTAGPTITGITTTTADGRYRAGALVTIVITFSEAVAVTGAPALRLETGATDRSASLIGGAGTTTLTLQYTVQAGDSTADLDYASTGALTGGAITDAAGNPASRTLPAPGAAGSIAATHAVVIAAAVPVMTGVTVTPTTAYTNDDLTCHPTSSDADGDPVNYTFTWQRGGVTLGGQTGSSLAGSQFSRDQAIQCTATPSDGSVTGAAMTSAAVTIQNSAPVMTSATVSPATAFTNDTLSCPATASDADGEAVGYGVTWYVGGSLVSSAPSLDGGSFSRDNPVHCVATPFDGTTSGSAMQSATIVIQNSPPPDPATVTLSESQAGTLTCGHSAVSDADGDTVDYLYIWGRNGELIAGASGPELSTAGFSPGETIECIVQASDRTASSGGRLSNSYLVPQVPQAPRCEPMTGLQCFVPFSYSTSESGATDQVSSYSCSGWDESGPEVGHVFTAPQSSNVTATLTNVQGIDLDVFVITEAGQGCSSSGCLGAGNTEVSWAATAGTTYYVVVDGYQGAQGSYTLTLSCQ